MLTVWRSFWASVCTQIIYNHNNLRVNFYVFGTYFSFIKMIIVYLVALLIVSPLSSNQIQQIYVTTISGKLCDQFCGFESEHLISRQ